MNPSLSQNPAVASTGQNQPRRNPRRWVPYAGLLLLIALIIVGVWPKPVLVETATAVQGTLRTTVNEEGKTRIKQRYTVSAPVAGQLRRIPFKAGAEVQAGETILAVIDPLSPAMLDARARTTAGARRDSALANFQKAQSANAHATSELRRFEKLNAEKTLSVQEFENVQLRQDTAAKEMNAAQSALRQAEAELAEFSAVNSSPTNALAEIKAPATGRVLRVFEESAHVVSAGTPLLEVGNPADIEVVVEVLSCDGAAIAPGAKVALEQWGGGDPLEARVRLVEPAAFTKVSALGVEEQRVNVIADLLTPPAQRPSVGDNFRVEARIVVWESDRTLKVPSGALFRLGDQWAAFVVRDGRAQLTHVKAGRSSGPETQVIEGLKEGDQVIVYPGDRVHDGQRVKPIKI